MRPRRSRNPKRKIQAGADPDYLARLAESVRYGGNPEHKRNPGDFGLHPPANHHRPDKSLCDSVGIFEKDMAVAYLRSGIRKGMISQNEDNGFPKNIWAVTDDGQPLEAQLENRVQGVYHGYPMHEDDRFRDIVLKHWNG